MRDIEHINKILGAVEFLPSVDIGNSIRATARAVAVHCLPRVVVWTETEQSRRAFPRERTKRENGIIDICDIVFTRDDGSFIQREVEFSAARGYPTKIDHTTPIDRYIDQPRAIAAVRKEKELYKLIGGKTRSFRFYETGELKHSPIAGPVKREKKLQEYIQTVEGVIEKTELKEPLEAIQFQAPHRIYNFKISK